MPLPGLSLRLPPSLNQLGWVPVALLLAVALPVCRQDPPTAIRSASQVLQQEPPAQRVLTFASGSHEFLDPAKVAETAGHHLMLNVFEGPYIYNRGNGPPVPAMATHHEVSPDGLTYTIHLRPGLVWSDGTPLTAEDFVWSWRRVLDPQTASRSAQLLWFIRGARAFAEGATQDPSTVAVRAIDKQTLEVVLESPTPFFDHLLCEMPYVPTPRHVVEKWGLAWTRPEHIVSNGPYLLVEEVPRKVARLKRNPRYFDPTAAWLDEIVVLDTESDQTAFDWYEVGRTQWHGDTSLPMDKVPALRTSGRPDFRTDPKLCTYYFSVRVDKPPLDDVRVRRAISLAIDKERLVLHVLKGGQTVATNVVPDLFGPTHGYTAFQGTPYDPEQARRLLAEAGYPRGIGLPPIEIVHNTGEGHRVIAEFVQRSLQENLGLSVTLANMEWGTLLKSLLKGEYQIGRSSWCADYPDPLTFLEVFASGSKANYPGYRSAEYDAVLAAIKAETDRSRRNQLLRKAEQILDRDQPILPIYHYTWSYLTKPYLLGYEAHSQDMHPLKYVRWATPDELVRIRRGEVIRLPPLPVGGR